MTPKNGDSRTEPVSVVIPAQNEAAAIGDALDEIVEALAAIPELQWEIVVVDDGSTDRTPDVVEGMPRDYRIQLVRHTRGRGYGAAIKTGMVNASHSWILIIDADGTYPARHIAALLEARDRRTMVVGARVGSKRHIPLIRRPAKWVLTVLASRLSGVEIVDLNSGLRVFKRQLAQSFLRILPDGFSLTSTITLAALASDHDVVYLPIDYRRRKGRSKIRPIRDTLGFLSLIFRTVMFFDPLRILLPLSLFFLLASVLVAVGSFLFTDQLMDVTTVLLLVTGVQILALGMIAEAINRRLP
jgi:glycosyltransferase involved in cell wall biosynthesis